MTIKRGWYKHFTGGYYYVIGTATHSETGEQMVIYYHQGEPSKLWIRSVSVWHELIDNYYLIEPRKVKDYE